MGRREQTGEERTENKIERRGVHDIYNDKCKYQKKHCDLTRK